MRSFFFLGLLGLCLFEFFNVYFIMPIPGSQEMNSIGLAYFLYSFRWLFRIIFGICIFIGIRHVFKGRLKWLSAICLIATIWLIYTFNFEMAADRMFLQAKAVILKSQNENKLPGNRLVIGIENNGEAKAYPIQFLAYHHQVLDSIGGIPIMVTYCSVCRSGRVYSPVVDGHYEKFRLVGMDHYNAMFEDETTGSWWRQATGEAVAGKMKGKGLSEIMAEQMSIDKWFELHPTGLVMQADPSSLINYDSLARFEQGLSKGRLTRRDSLSWENKSWILGLRIGDTYKAYDWNDLKSERIIQDAIDQTPFVLILSRDEKSFAAFETQGYKKCSLNEDTLVCDSISYNFEGKNLKEPSKKLKRLAFYQEFWHSWKTFHPGTTRYKPEKQK